MDSPRPKTSGHRRARLEYLCIFSALGLLGNYVSLSVGFNVDFIFGSVFGLMAVVLLGPLPGVTVSLIAASYTYVLWNHPYAVVIFGCEALWFVLARKRTGTTLFLIDALYWLILGVPMVILFYYGMMRLGLRDTGIIATKHALNGVCNAILAGALLNYLPTGKWLRFPAPPARKTSHIFFEAMAFLLLFPCLGGLIYMNRRDVQEARVALAARVLQIGDEASWLLAGWTENHLRAVRYLAEKGKSAGLRRSAELQKMVVDVHALFPDFLHMSVADGTATTLAFNPPVNERGESTIGLNFSDREAFKTLKTTKQPVISDVFMGRGGAVRPIFTIHAPILHNDELIGCGLGAVNLARLQTLFHGIAKDAKLSLTLLDRNGKVIISTESGRKPLARFSVGPGGGQEEIVQGVFLRLPSAKKYSTPMMAWKDAVLYTETPVTATGWTIVTEAPLAPLQQSVYEDTAVNLAAIFLLLLATSGVSLLLSRRLSTPLGELSRVSADIPKKIESGSLITWPSSHNEEVSALVANFRKTADDLREKIWAFKEHGEKLEAMVAERTTELRESMEEAQQAKTLLQSIFDAAPLAIGWTDRHGTVQYINRCFGERLGYDIDEIRSIDAWPTMAFPDPAYRAEILAKRDTLRGLAHEAGQTSCGPLEAWIECKDKTRRCFDVYWSDLPEARLGILSDITERKSAEDKLNAYARSQRVLLGEVNHRVKNNLAMLIAMLHLEQRSLKEEAYGKRIADIVGRVNALSTVHSLLSSTEWRPISLQDLCRQIITGVVPRDMNPRIVITPSELTVEASQANNIALVVNELATNTTKYATPGKRIEVTMEIGVTNDTIGLRYRDNGPGYPRDLLDGKPPSSGIGIKMLKGLVEMSLYGKVVLSNHDGAVAEITFRKNTQEENNHGE